MISKTRLIAQPEMATITLIAYDGTRVACRADLAQYYMAYTEVCFGDKGELTTTELDAPAIAGRELARVVEFVTKFDNILSNVVECLRCKRPIRVKDDLAHNDVPAALSEWIQAIPIIEVFKLLYAADALGMGESSVAHQAAVAAGNRRYGGLLDLCAARIARHYLAWNKQHRDNIFDCDRRKKALGPEAFEAFKAANMWANEEPDLTEELAMHKAAAEEAAKADPRT